MDTKDFKRLRSSTIFKKLLYLEQQKVKEIKEINNKYKKLIDEGQLPPTEVGGMR